METYKKALSIRQPWAWLIANGFKDIENRSWSTTFRGDFFIHASKTMTNKDYRECLDFLELINRDANIALPTICLPEKKDLLFGGLIGSATISACVSESESPWFTGKFGFVVENAKPLKLMPCLGTLQFFYPSY